jgi:hypothetical protein
MARLGAAIIAYDNISTEMTDQEIGKNAFPTISETQINYDVGAQRKNSSNQKERCYPDRLLPQIKNNLGKWRERLHHLALTVR